MKLMIASDIHGSAKWCGLLLERFKEEQPEKLFLLGDILYHGPRNDLPENYNPKQVIELLNSIKESIMCIQGNCDAEVDQMVLDFPIMSKSMSIYLDGNYIYASHGHIENEANPPGLHNSTGKAILLNGHTHVSKCAEHNDYIYINPGSVSIPKEDTPRGYIIYENNKFIWKNLDGEIYMEFNCNSK